LTERAERFTALFRRHYADVLAYALRRADESWADDVAAETFTAAWRHLDHLPQDPLPWLYRTARSCLANKERSARRQARLAGRLAGRAARVTPDHAAGVVEGARLRSALHELAVTDREAPTTQPVDQTTLNEIGAACTAQHRDMPPTPDGAGGQLPAEGWRTVLVDRRGPNAVALVLAPPGHMGVCRFLGLGQVPGAGIGAESSGGGGNTYAPRGDRVLTIENSGGTRVDPGGAIGSTSGQVGPDVARVAVTLDDGTWVQASVGGGWYLAWWPGKVRRFLLWQTTAVRRPQAVRAYDAAGRLLGERARDYRAGALSGRMRRSTAPHPSQPHG
jgi:DNA-directed RNA polymerase specialized sigma24 family protein